MSDKKSLDTSFLSDINNSKSIKKEIELKKNEEASDSSSTLTKNKRRPYMKRSDGPRRKVTEERIAYDEPILPKIDPDDSELVKIIKNSLYEKGYSRKDIDSKLSKEEKENSYNLIYGIRSRTSMTWETFTKWCEILDLEVSLKVTNK